ncbi:hypothetical protein HMPREF0476_0205 [Kingella kingae ATCC 23330]|uniref:Uncharacterized protein n=1 Tax=Kingella kingae ATCC 23330 TaxID=887327 RepID=F5S4S2_KINKI|nr:hypothetical protein HMPREF0476_0205 [Kingella kingae ATCC 23330]
MQAAFSTEIRQKAACTFIQCTSNLTKIKKINKSIHFSFVMVYYL